MCWVILNLWNVFCVCFCTWQIHWFSIFNSFMMVIFLVGLVSMILMRTLRKDYARYSKEEEMDDMVITYRTFLEFFITWALWIHHLLSYTFVFSCICDELVYSQPHNGWCFIALITAPNLMLCSSQGWRLPLCILSNSMHILFSSGSWSRWWIWMEAGSWWCVQTVQPPADILLPHWLWVSDLLCFPHSHHFGHDWGLVYRVSFTYD